MAREFSKTMDTSIIDSFVDNFGGFTEPYFFYNNQVELRYDPKAHVYLLVSGDDLEPQDGVTTVVHIIDKSESLIPWGCKMMATKLLNTAPSMLLPTGDRTINMAWPDFERLVIEAKSAHKEKLEEAASTGSKAHAWIEQYIKSVLAGNDARKHELLAKMPEDERAANCCLAAINWMANHNVKWICTERKIYSRKHKYAGTMDGKALVSSCDDPLCCPNKFTDRLSLIDWKTSNFLYMEFLLQTAAYEAADEEELGVPIEDRWVIRLGKDDAEFDPWHVEGETRFNTDFNAFLLCLGLTRAVQNIKDRIKAEANAIKAERKAQAKAAKEAALKIACRNSGKYKGTRKPTCNGGDPCQTCLIKYAEVQAQKDQDALVKLNMRGK